MTDDLHVKMQGRIEGLEDEVIRLRKVVRKMVLDIMMHNEDKAMMDGDKQLKANRFYLCEK